MTIPSIQERIGFVQSLQIGGSRASLAVATSKATAGVDAGSLVSFVADVSDQHRSDALNSTLLAQLHSDAMFDRFDKSELVNWYKNYASILGIIGWTMPAFQFRPIRPRARAFPSTRPSRRSAPSSCPPPRSPWSRLRSMRSASSVAAIPGTAVWDQYSRNSDGGNFQIASCSDNNGAANSLVLRMSAYSFNTTQSTTRFLWTSYDSSTTDLLYATQTATLDDNIYSMLRSPIVATLGAKASACIGDLNI